MPWYGYRLLDNQVVVPEFLRGSSQSPGFIDGTEVLSNGTLTYLQLMNLIKYLWEKSFPTIPILPVSVDRSDTLDNYPAVIGYAMELRRAHTNEPKPKMRQVVQNGEYTIYGQKFQNIISFTVMSKVGTFQGADTSTTRDDLDAAVLCDEIMEMFEDFMQEYTPILKAAGASDLVYSRRLSDSEINRDATDIHKRTVTYMITTEKTFAVRHEVINDIVLDLRLYMAKQDQAEESATPSVSTNIIDLYGGSTPNSG